MEQLAIKNFIYLFILSLISCKQEEKKIETRIHYQYVVYKANKNNHLDLYLENFLYLSNNSRDTIKIKLQDIIDSYKVIYKKDTLNLQFSDDQDIFILPNSSIDVNCITNLKQKVSKYPEEQQADSLEFNIYNINDNKPLKRTVDYEIRNTKNFMIFKDASEQSDSAKNTL
ncbi:hypothetical protein PFY10_06300 [Chryseobacterium daecheongense]|uniref:hypothetical protein n=1 Tax=Chryseobacterium sp. LAM-KRS1 TaxID=2715754 RepID=UPI001554DC91|nr:hypothetical protein [Chryseobacterium sp. LAM-KRS1]WBV58050.1 hypothetical protein PFY10_06300 [Chryseobacterium daecheongense]